MRRLLGLILGATALACAFASPALAGTVEGTVTPLAWAQEVEVCAYGQELFERCAVPGPDGSFTYPGVEGTVTLEFIPTYRSRLLTQYYDHKSTLKEATYITVGKAAVVEGIDADLNEGGSITGTVTAQVGGVPLPEVEVCAVSVSPPTVKSCEQTDAAGAYELHSLPTGPYTVGFAGHGVSAGYQPSSRPAVAVSAGAATPGIDAALAEGATIDGHVTAAAGGTPLGGITVCLFTVTGTVPGRCTETDGGGTYSFQGLTDGSYQVGFSPAAAEVGAAGSGAGVDGFESQFYDGVATRAAATTISLLAPERADGVDASLSTPPAIPPPTPAPPVGGPTTATAPTVAAPATKKPGCRKPRRKKKVKGKVRCVKPAKHTKSRKHAKHGRKKVRTGPST